MKQLKATIEATPNHSKRTFTIRKTYSDGSKAKYRTYPMNKEEFESYESATTKDWINFLNTSNEYKKLTQI